MPRPVPVVTAPAPEPVKPPQPSVVPKPVQEGFHESQHLMEDMHQESAPAYRWDRTASENAAPTSETRKSLLASLVGKDTLKEAMVLREILGPPIALRDAKNF